MVPAAKRWRLFQPRRRNPRILMAEPALCFIRHSGKLLLRRFRAEMPM